MIMKNVSHLNEPSVITRASVLDCGSPLPLFTRAVTTSAPITRSPEPSFHILLSNTAPANIENYRKIFAILSIISGQKIAQNPQPQQQNTETQPPPTANFQFPESNRFIHGQ
jgi:hypothetical protein